MIERKKKMKKYMVLCAGLCVALAFTSCKSSESAYKQAYLKAKQQEEQQQKEDAIRAEERARAEAEAAAKAAAEAETNVVVPLEEKPVTDTQVVDNTDNVKVTTEKVSLVAGDGLKAFSVVVGSFSLKANAEGLQQQLKNAGYDAQVVKNDERNMYRVIATTFDSKAEAAASRNDLQTKYAGAWLLYAK